MVIAQLPDVDVAAALTLLAGLIAGAATPDALAPPAGVSAGE
jgi:hypothetical protein